VLYRHGTLGKFADQRRDNDDNTPAKHVQLVDWHVECTAADHIATVDDTNAGGSVRCGARAPPIRQADARRRVVQHTRRGDIGQQYITRIPRNHRLQRLLAAARRRATGGARNGANARLGASQRRPHRYAASRRFDVGRCRIGRRIGNPGYANARSDVRLFVIFFFFFASHKSFCCTVRQHLFRQHQCIQYYIFMSNMFFVTKHCFVDHQHQFLQLQCKIIFLFLGKNSNLRSM
jgi:hypothetical protein